MEETFPKLLLNKTVKNNYQTVSYQSDFVFDFDWKKNEEVFVEVAIEIIYNDKREKKSSVFRKFFKKYFFREKSAKKYGFCK